MFEDKQKEMLSVIDKIITGNQKILSSLNNNQSINPDKMNKVIISNFINIGAILKTLLSDAYIEDEGNSSGDYSDESSDIFDKLGGFGDIFKK